MERKKRMMSMLLTWMLVVVMAWGSVGNIAYATESTKTTDDTKATDDTKTTDSTSDTEDDDSELEDWEKELKNAYEITIESNEIEGWPEGPGTYGEGAIIMEVGTGAILYAKNIDAHFYPASITKLLTTLVALENGEMSDTVRVTDDSVNFLEWDDASIGLKDGNEITLEQALYALLLASANEAAHAIGESVGENAGHDYDWFIEQMNLKCQELGGTNSNFVNTNGLHDDNHYTCARDMALIARELFNYPEVFEIMQTLQYTIPKSSTVEEHTFQQYHQMLMPTNDNYYEYAIGGKTGYTDQALSTLVTMADNGDMQLVCVVLKTHGVNVYPDTRNLFDYVYSNFSKVSIEENETSEDIGSFLSTSTVSTSTTAANTAADTAADTTAADTAANTAADAAADTAADATSSDDTLVDATSASKTPAGYVVVPTGVTFDDLDMELIPDDETCQTSTQATVEYSYQGNYLGGARVELSDAYIEAHAVEAEVEETENGNENETVTVENHATDLKGRLLDMAKNALEKLKAFLTNEDGSVNWSRVVLAGCIIIWFILVITLIRVIIVRKRKRR